MGTQSAGQDRAQGVASGSLGKRLADRGKLNQAAPLRTETEPRRPRKVAHVPGLRKVLHHAGVREDGIAADLCLANEIGHPVDSPHGGVEGSRHTDHRIMTLRVGAKQRDIDARNTPEPTNLNVREGIEA